MSERTNRLFDACGRAAARGRLAITGHDKADTDSVISCLLMRELLEMAGIEAEIVLATEPDLQPRRVLARFGMDYAPLVGELTAADALVLCDHHQPEHAGAVVACIDHHPTDYPPAYPYVQIEPAGACAVMVLRLFGEAGFEPGDRRTAMAVTALYLDTVALRSAKMPRADIPWARENAARLGLDVDWLTREGLHLRDVGQPAGELCLLNPKTYVFGGKTVRSSCVHMHGMTEEKLAEILAELRGMLARSGAALWVYLHHDPIDGFTREYDLWPDGRVDVTEYGCVASRGRDVMPRVERMMRESEGNGDG